tara:strand:- start:58 stop:393 length:336 start_codon:yes stop_codon:yes gene_type:complete
MKVFLDYLKAIFTEKNYYYFKPILVVLWFYLFVFVNKNEAISYAERDIILISSFFGILLLFSFFTNDSLLNVIKFFVNIFTLIAFMYLIAFYNLARGMIRLEDIFPFNLLF